LDISCQPQDPLSQVVFIHDYVQLVFEDCSFSLLNPIVVESVTAVLRQGSPGFCDALVKLIGQEAHFDALESPSIRLSFSSGTSVLVLPDGIGPEAWIFYSSRQPLVVEQNV
jgi:hypothetical protein